MKSERDQSRGLLAVLIALTIVVAVDLLNVPTRNLVLAALLAALTAILRVDLPTKKE